MDKDYIKKHFAGDLVRTILFSILIIIVISVIYDRVQRKREQELQKERMIQHHAEYQAWKEAEALKTPEQRFEEFVFDLDEKGIVRSVTVDETRVYINCGPLDRTADMSQARASAQSALSAYALCAKEEGLDKQVCIVGIDQYGVPIWEVAYDASSSVYNAPWEKECVVEGCPRSKVQGTAYCPVHQPGGLRNYIESLPGDHEILHQTTVKQKSERDIDDVDLETFYLDNMDEFDDFEDAWDYMEDNPDEWEDY